MNFGKCPGQDTRYWSHDDIFEDNCPYCHRELEFWKTDLRVKCHSCGRKVVNKRFNLGCAQWCAYAEQCLGGAAKGLHPDSIRSKIEEHAKEILTPTEVEMLKKNADKALEEAKNNKNIKVDIPVIIGNEYFRGIVDKVGEDEGVKIINKMTEEGHIPPKVATRILEMLNDYSCLVT